MSASAKISPLNSTDIGGYANLPREVRRYTRFLGNGEDLEKALADADSNPKRSLRAFRGINHLNPSLFAVRPLSQYRGIFREKYDGLVNPNYIPNRDPVFDNSYQDTSHPLEFNNSAWEIDVKG